MKDRWEFFDYSVNVGRCSACNKTANSIFVIPLPPPRIDITAIFCDQECADKGMRYMTVDRGYNARNVRVKSNLQIGRIL